MNDLTKKENEIYSLLLSGYDENYGESDWALIYLDNVIDTSDKTTKGVLGSLTKKDLYREVDGYAWGEVKKNA